MKIFTKFLQNLKQSAPEFMVYGELSRYPIGIQIKTRTCVTYWSKLINGKDKKYAVMIWALDCSKKIKRILTGLKISKVF